MGTAPDLAEQISAQLRTVRFGRPLHVYAVVTSTNDAARELAAGGAGEGAAVLALEQSRGRGRLGRIWQSPPGGLYLSIVLRPAFPMERWPLIGLACSLGAAAAAERHAGLPVRLKWPNDLLLDGRKLGGVLIETVGDVAVCGIGLNVIPPSEFMPPAEAAWLAERNPAVSLTAIIPDVLLECERRYHSLGADPVATLTEWRVKSYTLGGRVYIEGATPVEGIAEDIDTDGALLVRTSSGLRRVVAGEIPISGGPRGRP
jgi:BirA family biotin operon repressor/biotin-[acetyl-CoA-carboxylase] ligase